MKHLTSLLLVLVAGMTFSAFPQSPLQEKLDLVYQYGQEDNRFGAFSILNDIDEECGSTSDKNIKLQYNYYRGSLFYRIDKFNEIQHAAGEKIHKVTESVIHHKDKKDDRGGKK